MPDRPPADDLALTALRYAAGELLPAEAAAFEGRLAADQAAREALGEAIRLSAAALHRPAPDPDPLVREAVRDELRPTLVSWLFPRRRYRGHPLAWAGLGGALAAGLAAVGVWLGDRPDDGPPPPPTAVEVAPPPGVPTMHQLAADARGGGQLAEAPPPRPAEADDPDPTADPTPTPDRRAVATDAEEPKPADRIAPAARPADGKTALQPDGPPPR
jgi:hypothetical protein